MAKAAPLGGNRSYSAPRKPAVPHWAVTGVIVLYFVGLAAGILAYRRIAAPAAQSTTARVLKPNQRIGHILIVSPNGCQSGEFDNFKQSFVLSQQPCDEAKERIDSDAGAVASGDARIRAIGRYFRGAEQTTK
jgi:hypothetical protein